jgi:hypothetical protein
MAKFTTRVELHDADYDDYETLHAAMKAEGFTRTISNGNQEYYLPTAEYNREAALDKSQVLASAKRAAANTHKKYAVLVTESNGRTWDGLAEV